MLECADLQVIYDKVTLFHPVSFSVEPGNCTVIMGRSGIGKSSLLNAICGSVKYNGKINTEKTFSVFQDSNQLFPWYTIRKNLDLVCKNDYNNIVKDWNLTHLLDVNPHKISGGQRQRFTLIRAICSGAKVLLCDEPCSALDMHTGNMVVKEFKKIIKQNNLCCLWVTHNPIEAIELGDTVYNLTEDRLLNITGERDVTKFFN
jgi:ABC-type nitrate/sulfonate/bicarbonate transport system ATPase subunit